MGITIVSTPKQTVVKTYPYVGITQDGLKVLFTKSQTGTVLDPGETASWKIGYIDHCWDESQFERYVGTITIKCE